MVEELKSKELKTMKDHVRYLQQCVYDNFVPDFKVTAGLILNISDSPSHKGYYEGSKADPDYRELFDLASRIKDSDDEDLQDHDWAMLMRRLSVLDQRYILLAAPVTRWSEE